MTTGPAAGFATTGTEAPYVVNELDLAEVQRQFEQRLDDLLQEWVTITAKQRQEILDQVRLAVTSDDLNALASIHVSTSEAAQALTEAMSGMALEAGLPDGFDDGAAEFSLWTPADGCGHRGRSLRGRDRSSAQQGRARRCTEKRRATKRGAEKG